MTKIKKKNSILAIILAGAVMLGGCGSSAVSTDLDTETTESLEVTEATETTELEAVEVTEVTEAVEVVETTEATEVEDTETEEQETESESEEAEAETEEDETETYTYTELNKTMYAKKSVNVRNMPSTDGSKLGSLSSSQSVTVTGQCNETGWYRISYNGGTGYCSNNYLTSTKPSSTSSGSSSGSSNSGSSNSGTSSGSSNSGSSSGSSSGSNNGSSDSGSSSTKKLYDITDYIDEVEDKVIELTNQQRTAAGLSKLTKNSILMEAAEIRATEQKEVFGHTRPDGSTFSTAVFDTLKLRYDDGNIECWYYYNASEIAFKTAGLSGRFESKSEAVTYFANSIVNGWMSSEGHKAEIMRDDIALAGVGLYVNNGVYCIEMFASDVGYCIDGTDVFVE